MNGDLLHLVLHEQGSPGGELKPSARSVLALHGVITLTEHWPLGISIGRIRAAWYAARPLPEWATVVRDLGERRVRNGAYRVVQILMREIPKGAEAER